MRYFFLLLSFLLTIACLPVDGQTIQQVGFYPVNGIHSMSSKTNLMVLGSGELVDISVPTSPTLVGSVSFPGFASSTHVSGNYAYFGMGMVGKLSIANISNPSFPLQVGSRVFPTINGGIFGIAKDNNMLYLAAGTAGFFSVDVSNVSFPVVLDSIVIPWGQSRDVAVHSGYAFVAHYDGLKVVDISNPSNLNVVASIGSGYNSIDIDIANDRVFLGKTGGGVDVIDVSTPNQPSPLFAIPNSSGTTWDIKYRNGFLYLATDISGLFIYEITGNSAVQSDHFPNTSNGQSFGVSIQDNLVLLSGLINGVAVLSYDSLGIVGVPDGYGMDEITIFPNPASDYIEFKTKDILFTEIEILDAVGKLVHKESYTKNFIDISSLPKGTYIISLRDEERSWRRKLNKL